MAARPHKTIRVVSMLLAAFVVGGVSAAVGIRAHAAVERTRAGLESSAGQLVSLSLTDPLGGSLLRPSLIAPDGRKTELVLRDPSSPQQIKLHLKLETIKEANGLISLDYEIRMPSRVLEAKGKVSLRPGVESSIKLGDGSTVATWVALPVPAFDIGAFLKSKAVARVLRAS